MRIHPLLLSKNLIGLVLTRVEGGWQAAYEEARGSWSDGPVCADADAALAAVLVIEPKGGGSEPSLLDAIEAVEALPPPPPPVPVAVAAPPPPY